MMSVARRFGASFGLFALGCGGIAVSDRVALLDASPGTGALEAGMGGSSSAHATVIAEDALERPIADADVLVSTEDGSVFATKRTGGDGHAEVVVPHGGAVALLVQASGNPIGVPTYNRSILSAYGIDDGQSILFLLSALDNTTAAATPMVLNVRANAPVGARGFYFSVPCWSAKAVTEPEMQVTGFYGCSGKATFDVYVFALDGAGRVLTYGALLDQVFQAGSSRDLVIDASSTALTRQSVRVSPIADTQGALTVFMLGYRSGDYAHGATTGVRYEARIDPSGSEADVLLPWPAAGFTDYKFGARIELRENGLRRVTSFDRFQSAPPDSFHFDPRALSPIETLDEDTASVAHPVVSWTLSAAGRLGDALKISTGWSQADASTSWSIAVPATRSGSVRFPDLPEALKAFAPSSASTYNPGSLAARHFDDLARDGYGDYLSHRIIDDASNVDSSSVYR